MWRTSYLYKDLAKKIHLLPPHLLIEYIKNKRESQGEKNHCSWNTLQYHKQRATSRNEGKDDHWNILVQSYTFEICFNAMLVVDCWGRTSIISTCNCIELILCAVTDFPTILTKSFKLMQRGTASWCWSHILQCLTRCKNLREVGKDCKQGN